VRTPLATDARRDAPAVDAAPDTPGPTPPATARKPEPSVNTDLLVTGWRRYARWSGFAVLAAVTVYGLVEFTSGDGSAVLAYWRTKLYLLPVVLGFAMLDVALEGLAWIWVAARFGLRTVDWKGARLFLTAKAGLVMPAQLGRLIRPDAMARAGRGTVSQCLKMEGAVFVFDSLSVLALLVGMVAWLVHPLLGALAAVVLILTVLFLGGRFGKRLDGTRFELPAGIWWSWQSFAIVLIQMTGWLAHGMAYYTVVADLPGDTSLWNALFVAPLSAVLGVSTGLPGGVGAIEGVLGVSLRFNGVPAEHLALAIAAFRLVTFWIWIPIGWLALVGVGRRSRARSKATASQPETGYPRAVGRAARVESLSADGS